MKATSISLHVPTRVRITGDALAAPPAGFDAAVLAAVGRALARAGAVLADAGGADWAVRTRTPSFAWRGLPVDAADRVAFERRLRALLAGAVTGAKGDPAFTSFEDATRAPGAALPSEAYDVARGSALLGRYVVDSYGGDDQVELAVSGTKAPRTFDLFQAGTAIRVVASADDPELKAKVDAIADKATAGRPLGVLFRYDAPGQGRAWQIMVFSGNGPAAGLVNFGEFTTFRFQGEGADPLYKAVPYVPSPGPASAEVFALPVADDARRDFYAEHFAKIFEHTYRKLQPKLVRQTTAQYEAAVKAAIARGIDAGLHATLGRGISHVVKVVMGEAVMMVWMTPAAAGSLGWSGRARLTPITERTHHLRLDDKKGGTVGGTGQEHSLMFPEEHTGDGPCPKDTVPHDQWGGFMNEPTLAEIGDAGERFRRRMEKIAAAVGIPVGMRAGQFALDVAGQLKELAEKTLELAETTVGENTPSDGSGNLGVIDFKSAGSPVIRRIREIAGWVADLSDLLRDVMDTFEHQEYACAIHGMYRGNGSGWVLHLGEELDTPMKWVVHHLFVAACRSMLLQLLKTSEREIIKRGEAIDRYAPLFEQWIVPQITEVYELELLDAALVRHERETLAAKAVPLIGTVTGQEWLMSANALVGVLGASGMARSAGLPYEIVEDQEVAKVRDRKGALWSKDDLQRARALKRQTAEAIDPLFKQIRDLPEAMERFRSSTSIRTTLEELLGEMYADNAEMQGKAADDDMFAFKASQRIENTASATIRGTSWQLGGIHGLAHAQIGDAFRDSPRYPAGVDFLFSSEAGKESLKGFGIMVGLIALSVLVPGSGLLVFGAGVGLALKDKAEADEKKRLYRSLIDPDQVLSWAEVEAARFMAWFGLVLSLVPEAGTATKALLGTGRLVLRGEARQIGRQALKAIAESVAKEALEYAAKDLLQCFVSELIVGQVVGEIIEHAMGPVLDAIQGDDDAGPDAASADRVPALTVTDVLDAQAAEADEERAFLAMIRAGGRQP